MSSDLSIDSFEDSFSEFYLAPQFNYSHWNGRQVTWRDIPEVCSEIERQILEIYLSGNQLLAHQLATAYLEEIDPDYEIKLVKKKCDPEFAQFGRAHQLYIKEISERATIEARNKLYQAGLVKDQPPPLEPITPTTYPAICAWETYWRENGNSYSSPKSHSGGFKEFWKEHKKAIIIAAVVIAIAATVAVVIVTTARTGTNIAVATGASAVQAAIDGFNSTDDSNPNIQNKGNSPEVNHAIQNFAKTIGGTDVNHGSISTIETHTIGSEVTPEILAGLVTQWNENLTPSRVGIPTGALPEIPCQPPLLQTSTSELAGSMANSTRELNLPRPSPFPWVNEGISYLRWMERNYQEQLFKELEKAPNTSPSNSPTAEPFAQEVPPQYTHPYEWVPITEEPRPRFNEHIAEDYLNQTLHPSNRATKNNYASKAARFYDGFQSPPPYQKMKLIGSPDQSTIHYHCGIGNSVSDIEDGGTCLYNTMSKNLAVQPHLIHSDSIRSGLGYVLLEQIEKSQAQVREIQQGFHFVEDDTLRLPKVLLDHSKIQSSIDYEVENLSKIAQNILQQGNPKLKQLHVTFSNGGYIFNEALKQLPTEYRDTIVVVTTGSTAIIDQDLAFKVYNIIGDKDKGSQLCNGGLRGIERRKEKAEVDVIPQTETQKWIQGHYFLQQDYQNKINEYINKEIINQYEIY